MPTLKTRSGPRIREKDRTIPLAPPQGSTLRKPPPRVFLKYPPEWGDLARRLNALQEKRKETGQWELIQ